MPNSTMFEAAFLCTLWACCIICRHIAITFNTLCTQNISHSNTQWYCRQLSPLVCSLTVS